MVDKDVHTPAYKETAVKLKVLNFVPIENPLRPLNFRYSGKPTPQLGVEVERKWKRADYHMPGEGPALVQITSNGSHLREGDGAHAENGNSNHTR
jgi:formate dehydrogenase major subunit